jgi:putative DNA methylase
MTLPYRKKLIEVALPLRAINEASAREKSIRHGHPSTLHLWWARRPLAACRAVLFASLVDDPDSDPVYRRPDGTVDEDRAGLKRAQLFNLIEELVQWENSNNPRIINSARAEIARCVASRKIELGDLAKDTIIFGGKKGQKHPKGPTSGEGTTAWEIVLMTPRPEVVNAFLADYAPPVLDPFCGGGSIPLEAQRLGLRAYASDLNPVPVLITKALIEIPPKFAGRPPVNPEWQSKSDAQKAATVWQGAQGLAEDVRYYGQRMRDEAEKRIGHLYPKVKITEEMAKDRPDLAAEVGQEMTVLAWLWARDVESPNPVYRGCRVPLVRGFWLSKKSGKQAWVEPIIDREKKEYRFTVRTGIPSADQKRVIEAGTKIGRGCKFRCLLSDDPIPENHIKDAGNRGEISATLMAIVAEGSRVRVYLPPEVLRPLAVERPKDLKGVDAPLANDPRNLWCLGYGLGTFDKLFNARQLMSLTTFSDLVQEARERVLEDAIRSRMHGDDRPLADGGAGETAYADAVATYLALTASKATVFLTTLARWRPGEGKSSPAFGRQAIPMVWDFVDVNPFAGAGGDFAGIIDGCVKTLLRLPAAAPASVTQLDASVALPVRDRLIISTDPPYYDNIGYADLSDHFYVWLRRTAQKLYPSLFATVLTPKTQELIASPYRHEGSNDKARAFFEEGLGKSFLLLRDQNNEDFPLTVYYAFKQAEEDEKGEDGDEGRSESTIASTGWETMLEGLVRARFLITGTWPGRTESGTRLIAMGTNALASSVVIACRPRPGDARLATRREFINALRHELPEALKNLQHGNIAPVDMAQSAIGPGMAVFTRYSKVIESDGSPMTVRTALGIINQVLDEVLAEQEGDFDADTRWALAWFDQHGIEEGPFGVAETLSKAKNTAVNGLVEAGVVKAKGGKVRLVSRDELPETWDPAKDRRLTVWETTQHLIRTLQTKGEDEAAMLLNKLGGLAETARELAYRLYSACERNKWADEALAYNSLVIAWPELTKLALAERNRGPSATQREMF